MILNLDRRLFSENVTVYDDVVKGDESDKVSVVSFVRTKFNSQMYGREL